MTLLKTPKKFNPIFGKPNFKPAVSVVADRENTSGFNPEFLFYAGNKVDLGGGIAIPTQPSAGGIPLNKGTLGGLGTEFLDTATSNFLEVINGNPAGTTEMCIVAVIIPNTLSGNQVLYHNATSASSNNTGMILWTDDDGFATGNTNCLTIRVETARQGIITNSLEVDKPMVIVVDWVGGTGGYLRTWVNGNFKEGFDSGTNPTSITSGSISRLGGFGSPSLDNLNGSILMLSICSTALRSEARGWSLSREPYQIVKPIVAGAYYTTSVAPPAAGPIAGSLGLMGVGI